MYQESYLPSIFKLMKRSLVIDLKLQHHYGTNTQVAPTNDPVSKLSALQVTRRL